MEIIIGCDNAAVELKNAIAGFLTDKKIEVKDVGCYNTDDPTNYPAVARRVCELVLQGGSHSRGILVCGTGIGMCISANKIKGIRAAVCHDNFSAERSVLSNDCNVLCLGARVIGLELSKKIVGEWIGLTYVDGPSTPKVREILEIESVQMK